MSDFTTCYGGSLLLIFDVKHPVVERILSIAQTSSDTVRTYRQSVTKPTGLPWGEISKSRVEKRLKDHYMACHEPGAQASYMDNVNLAAVSINGRDWYTIPKLIVEVRHVPVRQISCLGILSSACTVLMIINCCCCCYTDIIFNTALSGPIACRQWLQLFRMIARVTCSGSWASRTGQRGIF